MCLFETVVYHLKKLSFMKMASESSSYSESDYYDIWEFFVIVASPKTLKPVTTSPNKAIAELTS
jgi:hypothetical protein